MADTNAEVNSPQIQSDKIEDLCSEKENQNDSKELVEELANSYSVYLNFETPKEKTQFEDTIEDMLIRLDEYCGLVDMIRKDTTLCITKIVPEIYLKTLELKKIFQRIDQLEDFVAVVRKDVEAMEDQVNKAEKELGTFSDLKKMFKKISIPGLSKKSAAKPPEPKPKFIPVEIFSTDEYFASKKSLNTSIKSKQSKISQPSDGEPQSPMATAVIIDGED